MRAQLSRCRNSRRTGFTLLELLVVLAILAILLNMLIGATAGARDSANRITCTSNLRQLLMAAKMYEEDSGHLPIHYAIGFYGQQGHWQEQVYPYVKNRDIFVCRSDPYGGTNGMDNLGGWPTSYGHFLSDLWLDAKGGYRPPATRSPLFWEMFHKQAGKRIFLIGRYDGSVEAARPLKYPSLQYEPADGLGMIYVGPTL